MPNQPTAASELRRGLNRYNLVVGLASAVALGVAVLLATATGLVPRLGIGLGGRHPDTAGVGSLADVLQLGYAVQDLPVETRKVVSRRRGSVNRNRWEDRGRPRFHGVDTAGRTNTVE